MAVMAATAMLATPDPARACTVDAVLDLVGRLEGRGGYETIPRRSLPETELAVTPTRMTVAEVIEWQGTAVRGGALSTGVGRYRIVRPALRRLVQSGVVGPTARFDAATQDRLARALLLETGYSDGSVDPDVANRIAGIWPSLPRFGDDLQGREQYTGVAGNHARIPSSAWEDFLACRIDAEQAAQGAASIQLGERFGVSADALVAALVEGINTAFYAVSRYGTSLLLTLFVLDVVMRGARWALNMARAKYTIGDIFFRVAVVAICLAVFAAPEAVTRTADIAIRDIAGDATQLDGGSFSFQEHLAGLFALSVTALEDVRAHGSLGGGPGMVALFAPLAILILIAGAAQVFAILFWNIRLLLVGAAGMLAVAFGGLSSTASVPMHWVRGLVGSGFALLAAILVAGALGSLVWEVRELELHPFAATLATALLLIVAAITTWMLPQTLLRLGRGDF